MKTTTAIRLKQAMDLNGFRQVDVLKKAEPYCEKFDVKLGRNDLSQYVSGKVSPGQEKLTVLALALNVSETWLMGYDVPMEPGDYEDLNVLRFDAELEEALDIIEKAGYSILISSYPDDGMLTIQDKSRKVVSCMYDYELVSKYESLQKKGTINAHSLLSDPERVFLSYLDSLGYHLYRDDPEHKPFMSTDELTCRLGYNTLGNIKSCIDSYAKATVDSELLALKEEEIRQERLEKERMLQHLRGDNVYKGSQFEQNRNATHLEPQAAHERTDIEVTEEMRKHDDDIMDDDDFWNK